MSRLTGLKVNKQGSTAPSGQSSQTLMPNGTIVTSMPLQNGQVKTTTNQVAGNKLYYNVPEGGYSPAELRYNSASEGLAKLGDTYKYTDDAGLQKTAKASKATADDWLNNPNAHGYNANITEVKDLYEKVMNAQPFSYDPQKDALFQMYASQYDKAGQRAMANAMGVGTAMSGGYNSSAAQTAAQTAYQNYLDGLNEKVGETYGLALDRYNSDRADLLNQYNIANDINQAGNEAYWTLLNAYMDKADTDYNAYWNDYTQRYGQWSDQRNYLAGEMDSAQTQINADRDFNYQRERDAIADEQRLKEFTYMMQRDDIEDAQKQKELDAMIEQWGIENEQQKKALKEAIRQGDMEYALQLLSYTGG